jgi:photosystem I P700 chlorophyll a apoprotein A1
MIIRSPEPEVKILVDRDPIKTSFEEWARPGHFSRTIAKGLPLGSGTYMLMLTISIVIPVIWTRKVFSAHFGPLSFFG